MPRHSKPTAPSRRTSPARASTPAPSVARPARARVTAARRALDAGEAPDLADAHSAFESLRDATEQPAKLFALAVDEARLVDAAAQMARARAAAGPLLVPTLMRVLAGSAAGANAKDTVWAAERLESALRGAAGRGLDDAAHARALAALADGYERAGDLASARRAATRWAKRAEKLGSDADRDRALTRAFELAIAASDAPGALECARARAEALLARDGAEPADRSDALAPVAQLYLEAGNAPRALEAAQSWLAAERVATARAPGMRGARLADALEALARAAHAAGDESTWAQASLEWAAVARAHAGKRDPHGATRLAHALGALTDVNAFRGDHDATLASAREWLAAERAAGVPLSALGAVMAVTAQMGDWTECSRAVDEFLRAGQASGDPAAMFRATALAARARFALGDYDDAAGAATNWLGAFLRGENPDEEGDAGFIVAIAAQCADAASRLRTGAARTRVAQASASRARVILAALEELPRARRDPNARGAALAWLALAERTAGSDAMARRHANEALAKLESAKTVSRGALSFVAYVHEWTGSGARPRVGGDALVSAARALAASDARDCARAGAHLASINAADLASAPDALAHTLAASARALGRLAPDDPALAPGITAWKETAAAATLAGAIPSFPGYN